MGSYIKISVSDGTYLYSVCFTYFNKRYTYDKYRYLNIISIRYIFAHEFSSNFSA